jgi:hypothetical protein
MGDVRTRIHEASHVAVARCFGWQLGPMTAAAGLHSEGCALFTVPGVPADVFARMDASRPFTLWEPELRRTLETRVMVSMAGEVGALLLMPRAGRYIPPVRERAVALAASLPEPSAQAVAEVRELADSPTADTDAHAVAQLAWAGFGSDYASAGMFLQFAEAQTRAIVDQEADRIRRLADVLAERATLTGQAAETVLAG